MAQPNFERLQDLFNKARQLSAEERVEFLDQACESDTELRREVEALLEHDNSELIDDSPLGLTRPIAELIQGQTTATKGPNREEPLEHSRIGPYLLLKKIGEGGMGTVWMAEQKEPVRRRVALKLIRAGKSDKRILRRFEAERQALAMMDHANIAKILNAGTTDDGMPYFVMELVQGIPINKYCDQNKLAPRKRLELFVSICNAVQHAHQKGIIHRDLKPSNVLVATQDDKPLVKVIDFGLAKALQPQLKLTPETMHTEFGQIMGTLQYMSPEQAGVGNLDVDTRTDIYSLGSILYKLLTGFTPIDDDSMRKNALDEIYRMIREQDPPRPSRRLADSNTGSSNLVGSDPQSLGSSLRNELDWIVMCALEKDRDKRYKTVAALADDVKNYLTGVPVAARPPSRAYQIKKFVARHKGLAITLTIVSTMLFTSLAAVSWFAWQTNKALSKANLETNRAVAAENKAKQKEKQQEAALARSNYVLANLHWSNNNPREANRYLDMVPDSEEYRNFEWYLSKRQFSGSDTTFFGHEGSVVVLAYSPDGKLLVSGSADSIKIWDAQDGSELKTLLGHKMPVRSVCFSPDGNQLASGSWDNSVKIWDVNSGVELATFSDHTDQVTCVSFSPNGQIVASGSKDKTIRIWEAKSGNLLQTLDGHTRATEKTRAVTSIDFSPDGKQLASVGGGNLIKIWSARNGSLLKTLRSSDDYLYSVRFSPDGRLLAVGGGNGRDGLGSIWDSRLGTKLKTFEGHPGTVRTVAFSPSGTVLASACDGKTLKLWNIRTGKELKTLSGHEGSVYSVAFNPTGTRLATGGSDKTVRQWDVQGAPHLISLEHHDKDWISPNIHPVRHVAFGMNGEELATVSSHQIKFWDPKSGRFLKTIAGQKISGFSFCGDGKTLATISSWEQTIKLWNTQSGTLYKTLAKNTGAMASIAFGPDGKLLATGGSDGTISLWDVESGSESKLETGIKHTHPAYEIAFSPDGSLMVTCGPSAFLIWDVQKQKCLKRIEVNRNISCGCVAFSQDGTRLAAGFLDGNVEVLDTQDWHVLKRMDAHLGYVSSVAFSPGGKRMATAGGDHLLKVWDVQTWAEVKRLAGHTDRISSIAFNSSGSCLASGSHDGTAKLWLAPRRSEVRTFFGDTQFWHEKQANQSRINDDWFAATFHWAWALKQNPNRPDYYRKFRESYGKLLSGYAQPKEEVNEQLPEIMREALGIARPELVAKAVPSSHLIVEAFELEDGHLFRYKDEKGWTQLSQKTTRKLDFLETERDSEYIYLKSLYDIRIPLEGGQVSISHLRRKPWKDWQTAKKIQNSDFTDIKEYHLKQ